MKVPECYTRSSEQVLGCSQSVVSIRVSVDVTRVIFMAVEVVVSEEPRRAALRSFSY